MGNPLPLSLKETILVSDDETDIVKYFAKSKDQVDFFPQERTLGRPYFFKHVDGFETTREHESHYFGCYGNKMGAGASTDGHPQHSSKFLQVRIGDLRERELREKEEGIKKESEREEKVDEAIQRLRSERNAILEILREKEYVLNQTVSALNKQKEATLSLMLSELPLKLLKEVSPESNLYSADRSGNLASSFPLVSVLHSDIVGFAALTGKLTPKDLIGLIDRVHAIVDEALSDPSIFIMARDSDVCTAVCGVKPHGHVADREHPGNVEINASHVLHASTLATAALKLMSYSNRITLQIPNDEEEAFKQSHLQLRVSLHCGPCTGGIVGLQQTATTSTHHVLKYKLFGPAIEHARRLCATGLALQIRVSDAFRSLLVKDGGFVMERSPDYSSHDPSDSPIVSYWLLGRDGLDLTMPSLDHALPLSMYGTLT